MNDHKWNKGDEGKYLRVENFTDFHLAVYFFHLPLIHPVWEHFILSLVQLQDEGKNKKYEIALLSITNDDPDPHNKATWRISSQTDVVVQFGDCESQTAIQTAEIISEFVVNGILHPEPKGILGMKEMWEKYIQITVKEIESGEE